MKTQIGTKVLLVMNCLFVTFIFSAMAGDTENVKTFAIPGKKVLLWAYNPQEQPISIEIRDAVTNCSVYTSEQPGDATYRKVYNLSNLPVGNYIMAIRFNKKVFEKEIQIYDYNCMILKENVYNVPEFEIKDKDLVITYPGLKNEKVNVSFLNGNETFFNDESSDWKASRRKYNLAELMPGDYQVLLLSGDKSYTYNFDVR